MKIKTTNKEFCQFLGTLDEAGNVADEVLVKFDPKKEHSKQTLAVVWEITFDYVCRNKKALDSVKLNNVANVIRWLAHSECQLQDAKQRGREFKDKRGRKRKTRMGLTPEERQECERDLNLLG